MQQKVVDLTQLSDVEVNELINKNNGNLCGISTVSNFNTAYYLHPFRRFALAILIVFGSSVFTLSVQAQDVIENIQKDTINKVKPTNTSTLLKGVVVDKKTNEPLPFVMIVFEDNGIKQGGHTDFDGYFNIDTRSLFQYNDTTSTITLTIQYVGYKKVILENIKIEKGKILNLGSIQLEEEEELEVIGYVIPNKHDFIGDPNYHRSTTIKSEDINGKPKKR